MLTRPAKLDERARLREPANDVKRAARWPQRDAARMLSAGRDIRQHSSRFSVVALLATLWRPF